jgi:hypothetical protein
MSVAALLSFPVAWAHEATHYAAAKPWVQADESGIHTAVRDGEAYARLAWTIDTPRWAVAVAHLAPTILGFALGAVVAVWFLASGGDLPEAVGGWARLSLACLVWALYTTPSREDLLGWREVGR